MTKYLVNHGGVVHSVNDEEFAIHLGMASKKPTEEDPAGKPAREATPEEVAAYFKRQGLQQLPDGGCRRLSDGHIWDSALGEFVAPDAVSREAEVAAASPAPADDSAPDKTDAKADSKASK